MTFTYSKLPAFAAAGFIALTASCKESDDSASASNSPDSIGGISSKGGKTMVSMSDLMDVGREIHAYKEEIGYKEPEEADKISNEVVKDIFRLAKLKDEHPAIQELKKEAAESNEKLMEAVKNKDKEAQKKWGRIAGGFMMKKRAIVAENPEFVALQKEIDEKNARIEQLRYEELTKTPRGKELADKLKSLTERMENQYKR